MYHPGRSVLRTMQRIWGLLVPAALLGAAFGVAVGGACALLPRDGEVAAGLRVAGRVVDTRHPAQETADRIAGETLARRVRLSHGDEQVLEASLAELGAQVDTAELTRRLSGVG